MAKNGNKDDFGTVLAKFVIRKIEFKAGGFAEWRAKVMEKVEDGKKRRFLDIREYMDRPENTDKNGKTWDGYRGYTRRGVILSRAELSKIVKFSVKNNL